MVILYSIGCPKCQILKKKLELKGVNFTENNDVNTMKKLEIDAVPVLSVNGLLMDFNQAVEWLKRQ